jgi:5-methylthioadenosine/S-adenosylhomocysteine deaminase
VIIHGTAFGNAEFAKMGQVGAKLIWSPQSNLALYGKTTNIPLALKHHVPVSLGIDWNPTGTDDIFSELRVAEEVNREQFDGAIKDEDWLKMITVNPAQALALDAKIGRLAPRLKADITVLRANGAGPHESLLRATRRTWRWSESGGAALRAGGPCATGQTGSVRTVDRERSRAASLRS